MRVPLSKFRLYPRELRAVAEAVTVLVPTRLPAPPQARGRTVMLIPGFLAPERTLSPLARWLATGGWTTVRGGVAASTGCFQALVDRLAARIEDVLPNGDRALIIGQSQGGMLGRALAVQHPELVDIVVSLGAPVGFDRLKRPLRAQLRAVAALGSLGVPGLPTRECVDGACCARFRNSLHAAPPQDIRLFSIWSHLDGVIDPDACHDPHAQSIEVFSSHRGMAMNVTVWRELTAILAASWPESPVRHPKSGRGDQAGNQRMSGMSARCDVSVSKHVRNSPRPCALRDGGRNNNETRLW